MDKKLKAAVTVASGKIEIQEFQMPALGKGAAICKILMAGVCGTDKHTSVSYTHLDVYKRQTVSNVINGRGNVSVEKIRLVWQAAEKLGYKVNTKAQSLRQGKDRTIAVLLPGIEYERFAAIYEVFQSEFSQQGYSVQLYSCLLYTSRCV